MSEKYYVIDKADTKLGPFSLEELRMLWATNDDLSVETLYIKEEEGFDIEKKRKTINVSEGHLGDIRDQLRPLLKKNEALVDGYKVNVDAMEQEKTKTVLKVKEVRPEEEKTETTFKNKNTEELKKEERLSGTTNIKTQGTERKELDLGMDDWGSNKKLKKRSKEEEAKRKAMQQRAVLLFIVVLIIGYIFADMVLDTKLDGRYVPESNSITPIRNNLGGYVDDLIRLRDYLGVPSEPKTWDQSVIPNFYFKAGVFTTKVYMTQGSMEFEGRLIYVDPSTAYIRLNKHRGHLYIITLDEWKSFRYYGIEYTPSSF